MENQNQIETEERPQFLIAAMDDPDLSFAAKGLLPMLFVQPFNKVLNLSNKNEFKNALQELQERCYIGNFSPRGFEINVIPFSTESCSHE